MKFCLEHNCGLNRHVARKSRRLFYGTERKPESELGQIIMLREKTMLGVYDKLLIVLSESSLQSEWVMTELRNARKAERQAQALPRTAGGLRDAAQLGVLRCGQRQGSGRRVARVLHPRFLKLEGARPVRRRLHPPAQGFEDGRFRSAKRIRCKKRTPTRPFERAETRRRFRSCDGRVPGCVCPG